jgi:hypothetical protein
MAGLIDNDDSLEEDRSLLRTNLFNLENLLLPNHNVAHPASSPDSYSSTLRTTAPQDALVTSPPSRLEFRQNNPQDCSNLITASVNRATVEISRTIISLNTTFSQQLQQASISASNGIKSAQDSATSTINVVALSASSATSSAFSSLTIANLAVTSANFALTNAQASASTVIAAANSSLTLANLAVTSISSASSSDVSTLSSSLSELQASLTSVQVRSSSYYAKKVDKYQANSPDTPTPNDHLPHTSSSSSHSRQGRRPHNPLEFRDIFPDHENEKEKGT